MSAPRKETGESDLLALTKGISQIYRALLLVQARLSEWKPETETLFSKYARTGDPYDFDAFAIHVSGELARLRETLKREVTDERGCI
jgi:hypothetical protein